MRRNFNRALLVVAIILGALFILTPLSFSETEIKVSGQVRVRSELEKKTFVGLDTLINDFTLMRTRLGLDVRIDSNTSVFLQFQDSRRFGDEKSSGYYTYPDPGGNVDIHQANINIRHLWKNGPGLKAGRFEVAWGNERVFGAVDWSNTGRAWQGFIVFLERPYYKVNGFWLRKYDVMMGFDDFVNDIIGAYLDINRIPVQLFIYYEYNKEFYRIEQFTYQKYLSKIYNVGIYKFSSLGTLNLEANIVHKFGNGSFSQTGSPVIDIENHSAFLITLDAGMVFDSEISGIVNTGIDFSSGDNNTSDNEIKDYDNPYYTGHKFRGYMDYFVSSSYYGLVDLYLKGKIDPIRGWTTACDIHYFTAAADYTDFRGERTKDIGAEIDFTVNTSRISGVGLQAGASIFFPTESYAARVHPRPGLWGYTMLTANF